MVEEGLKKPLVYGSSIYQIEGQPGHRVEELVFVLKSVIARQRARGNTIIIQPGSASARKWELSSDRAQ